MSETQEQTALAVVETLVPAKLFAPGNIEDVLIKIEDQVRKEAAELDPRIKREADKLVSLSGKVSSSKVAMDNAGKSLIESEKKKIDAINAERKMVRDRMDKLRDETKKPVTDERNRVDEHERELAALAYDAQWGDTASLEEIEGRLAYLGRYPERDWQEFSKKADKVVAEEIAKANNWMIAAKAAADAVAERARLEAEEAERQRIADDEAQKAREAEIERQAAEQAKAEAERAAKEAADRESARVKAEQERIEAEKRAAERRAMQAEQDLKDAITKAEAARVAAEIEAAEREKRAVEAERKRAADDQAERDRIAAAEKAEAEKKANDKAHRAEINNKIVAALSAIVPEAVAKEIIKAIVLGTVPNVKVIY